MPTLAYPWAIGRCIKNSGYYHVCKCHSTKQYTILRWYEYMINVYFHNFSGHQWVQVTFFLHQIHSFHMADMQKDITTGRQCSTSHALPCVYQLRWWLIHHHYYRAINGVALSRVNNKSTMSVTRDTLWAHNPCVEKFDCVKKMIRQKSQICLR